MQFLTGEYEGLEDKFKDPKMKPDFGPSVLTTFGASCVGARNFLIAYCVNILGTKEQAHQIVTDIKKQSEKDICVKIF